MAYLALLTDSFQIIQDMCRINSVATYDFHETCHFVAFYFTKKDSKRCYDTTTPESIHTKDESKRSSAFAFIFGVN